MRAVPDKQWKTCPYCGSQVVAAVDNGVQAEGCSTDLMLCHDCGGLYIVFPEEVLQPPADVEVDMSGKMEKIAKMVAGYADTQKAIDEIRLSDIPNPTQERKVVPMRPLDAQLTDQGVEIVSGHYRLKAAFALGKREMRVYVLDKSGKRRPATLVLGEVFPHLAGLRFDPHIVIRHREEKWVASVYEGSKLLYVIVVEDDEDLCRQRVQGWLMEKGKDYPIEMGGDLE